MGIKYQVNEKFFDVWTRKMAYVLGYLYADGSMEDAHYLRGKYIRVTSIDKKTILQIRSCLDSRHTVTQLKPSSLNGKPRFALRIGSYKLYNALTKRGLYPNKSLTIQFPHLPQKYLGDFVRGYFDGDGCIYLQQVKGKQQKLIVKKLSTIFTCGSKSFLESLANLLSKNCALSNNKIYDSHRSYQLRYGTRDSIRIFSFLYHNTPHELCLERKLKTFIHYFKLRPTQINDKVGVILKSITMATW